MSTFRANKPKYKDFKQSPKAKEMQKRVYFVNDSTQARIKRELRDPNKLIKNNNHQINLNNSRTYYYQKQNK